MGLFKKLYPQFADNASNSYLFELNRRIERAMSTAGSSDSIVYRQGATTHGNVYGTWPAAAAAAAAIDGAKTIFVDDALGQPEVTAGEWDLGGYTVLRGRQQGAGGVCPLVCRQGAVLKNAFQFRALRITSESDAAVIRSRDAQGDSSTSRPTWVLAEGSSIECLSSGPFFNVNSGYYPDGGFSQWWLDDDAKLIASPVAILTASGRSTGLIALLNGKSTAEKNTVSCYPNAVAYVELVNAGASADSQDRATIVLDELASRVAFDGSTWPHLGATEVQGAIDALAARLRWGAGGPEGVVTAPVGTLYLDTAGGRSTLYVKETGTGNTGWVGK